MLSSANRRNRGIVKHSLTEVFEHFLRRCVFDIVVQPFRSRLTFSLVAAQCRLVYSSFAAAVYPKSLVKLIVVQLYVRNARRSVMLLKAELAED